MGGTHAILCRLGAVSLASVTTLLGSTISYSASGDMPTDSSAASRKFYKRLTIKRLSYLLLSCLSNFT